MMMMMSDSAFSELEFKIFNLILESLSFAIKASTEFIMYRHTDACIQRMCLLLCKYRWNSIASCMMNQFPIKSHCIVEMKIEMIVVDFGWAHVLLHKWIGFHRSASSSSSSQTGIVQIVSYKMRTPTAQCVSVCVSVCVNQCTMHSLHFQTHHPLVDTFQTIHICFDCIALIWT